MISGFGTWHCIELLLTNNSRATQLYTKNLVVSMIWGTTGGKESSLKTKSNTFELDFVCLPILSIPVGVRFYLESRRITDHGVTFSRVGGRQQKFLQHFVRQDGDGGLVLLVAWRRCRVLPAHQFLLICILPDMGIVWEFLYNTVCMSLWQAAHPHKGYNLQEEYVGRISFTCLMTSDLSR